MKLHLGFRLAAGVLLAAASHAQPRGDVSPIHDPAIVRQGDRWYIFATNQFNRNDVPQFCSAVSTFGSNHSVIGLTSNKMLDPESPDYHWNDRGLVLESNAPGNTPDDFNAIDPDLVQPSGGVVWLAFGSFWDGIKPAQGRLGPPNCQKLTKVPPSQAPLCGGVL